MAKPISAKHIMVAIDNCVAIQTAHIRNFKKLPKAKDARLVPCTNYGSYKKDGKFTVRSWNIEVDVEVDGKVVTHDWNVWLVGAGMKCTTSRFTDLAKAKAMKKEILTKWGKYESAEKAKRTPKFNDKQIEALSVALNTTPDAVRILLAK